MNLNGDLNLLVISFFFAPDGEIGAKRITRFSRYLSERGIQPIVLTIQEQFLIQPDNEFPVPPGVRVERTPMRLNPLDWYARVKMRIAPPLPSGNASIFTKSTGNSRPGLLRRQMLALLNTPDRFLGWYFPAVKAAEQLIKQEPIGAMFSSGPPWTAHLIAGHLKRKFGIPWAADFRDSWALNPLLDKTPEWIRKVNARMETRCLKTADLVVCNTELLRRSFIERHPLLPKEKFVTLTNGFDDSVASPAPITAVRSARSGRLLLHFGMIYGRRRIDTFCQAANSLLKAGKLAPGSFKIVFHGEVDPGLLAAVHERAPELVGERNVEFEPFIESWQDAQKLLWEADLLLIFSGSPLEVPAKFYEYLKTGKPIFAVAERGALTELLDSTGSGVWADPADPDAIAIGLMRALELPAIPPEEAERRWADRFHFRSLSAQLARWIRGTVAERSSDAVTLETTV
ncbi:MAG TPA: glycosyltransferase [Terriglobales bacterium]|nr:glycosyltransferase [Terriglobales bacterium]